MVSGFRHPSVLVHFPLLFSRVQIANMFVIGMTETCTATNAWPLSQQHGTSGSEYFSHIGSQSRLCQFLTLFLPGAGHLFPGVKARVVKLDGTEAGYDEPGELIIWTPSRALGYHNNEQA